MITLALSKGRLAERIIEILDSLGITCKEMTKESRKLVFISDDGNYQFFLSKPADVPTYVDYGVADIGIVGKDTIMEENRDTYELLDLGYGKCRMCVAGYANSKELLNSGQIIRVATKYPRIAKAYFEKKNRSFEIIKLNGSVELGPVVGMSDVIVDIVESGKTLQENNLIVLEEIAKISARLIVNCGSMKTKYDEVNQVIHILKETLGC